MLIAGWITGVVKRVWAIKPEQKVDTSVRTFWVTYYFISMILLRIPRAEQPETGIEVFKYQASDG